MSLDAEGRESKELRAHPRLRTIQDQLLEKTELKQALTAELQALERELVSVWPQHVNTFLTRGLPLAGPHPSARPPACMKTPHKPNTRPPSQEF